MPQTYQFNHVYKKGKIFFKILQINIGKKIVENQSYFIIYT